MSSTRTGLVVIYWGALSEDREWGNASSSQKIHTWNISHKMGTAIFLCPGTMITYS